MQISVMIDTDNVIKAISTTELIPYLEKRQDKNEILEAFSNQELIAYMFHNKLIKEDDLALAIESNLISLELLLGKIAAIRFQKNINVAANDVIPKK